MKSLWLVSILLLAIGCAGGAQEPGVSLISKEYQGSDAEAPGEELPGVDDAIAQNRHVIYNAEIDLEVSDFAAFRVRLPSLVAKSGGYISNVRINQYQTHGNGRKEVGRGEFRSGKWELKVKSSKFDSFVAELSKIGLVARHHQTSQDVTNEYVDLEARIKNKQRMESRVLELINESKRSLNEVVTLEKELARIRGEVERMQGRLNVIKNRTQFATLTIQVRENAPVQAAEPLPLVTRISAAWGRSLALLELVLSSVAVFVAYTVPWLVVLTVIGTPVVLIWRRLSQRRLQPQT